jgi:hypothetical protein
MPKIIIQADESSANPAPVTLSERVIAEHLRDSHYATQLIERLSWAAADAEALELPSAAQAFD